MGAGRQFLRHFQRRRIRQDSPEVLQDEELFVFRPAIEPLQLPQNKERQRTSRIRSRELQAQRSRKSANDYPENGSRTRLSQK